MLLLHDHPHEILFAILSRQTESTTAPVVWDSLQLCLMDLNVVDWTSVTDKSHAQSPTHTWYRYSAVVSSSRGEVHVCMNFCMMFSLHMSQPNASSISRLPVLRSRGRVANSLRKNPRFWSSIFTYTNNSSATG